MAEETSSSTSNNTDSIDDEEELRALVALLDKKIHMVIENEQIIILANEILKESFSKDSLRIAPEEAGETFELISSAVDQNAITLREIRRRIRSLATY